MLSKKFFLIPIGLTVITIITSIISFNNYKELAKGYFYMNDNTQIAHYEGEYLGMASSIGENTEAVKVNLSDKYLTVLFNENDNIIQEYDIIINEKGQEFDKSIITDYVDTLTDLGDLEDFIFILDLEKDTEYEIYINKTENHTSDETAEFFGLQFQVEAYKTKSISEGISFTSGVFALISLATIAYIRYMQKRND